MKTRSIFFFFIAIVLSFLSGDSYSQTSGISGVNVPTAAVCSGEDFTVTFNYYWANFPSPTGLQEIEVTVPIPAGLQPAANTNPGGINPAYGTVTYDNITNPTWIRYNITADLTVPSGGGTVQVNLRFPPGTTCNGDKKCFYATSRFKQNNVWSAPKSTPDTFCVTAKAFNNWSVDKDVMWCRWDDTGRSVLYRITVQNNTQANNWDPTCSINIPTYTLTDIMGTNATFGGIVVSPPGFAASSWIGATTSGSTITFINGPVGGLNVLGRYYYVYFWVRYPNSSFNNITSVTNRVNLNATDTCKNVVRLGDSVRADLCKYLNQGSLSKTFTQTIGTPPNPTYFPNLSPGCCGSYSLVYKNTGTVDQSNLITIDRVPDNVDFGSVRTVITEPGMTCEVRYSTDNGGTYPPGNVIGTYTTVNTSGFLSSPIPVTATHIKWTYGGTALPVGYTLTNNISFCVRNNTYRSNTQGNDANANTLVDPGETIRNVAETYQNSVLPTNLLATVNNDLVVSPIAPKIVAHKMFIGNCVGGVSSSGGPWYPGQIVRYRMAIANIGSQTATNCVITDLLPQYLSYFGSPTYVWYTATSIPGVSKSRPPCDTIPVLANTTAAVGAIIVNTALWGNQERVTWNFPTLPKDCDGFPSYLIIDFDVKIQGPVDPALAGGYCNTYNFTATEVPAPGHNSNEVCFTVTGDPQFVGDKSVGLSPNGPWSTSASVAAGQQGYYKIKIKNTGNMPLAQLSLLDILPQPGDRSLLGYGNASNYVNRNSSYGIALSGPIQYVTGSNITTSDFTVKYTTTTDAPTAIKRADLGLHFPFLGAPNVDPIGAISSIPTWSTTFPTGAKAFTLEVKPIGHPILAPSEYLEILAPFIVDGNAGNDSIACNSFAYQAKPTGLSNYNGGVLVSEKGPVCVTAIADSIIDGGCECDSAFFSVNGDHPNVQEEWKTINVINKKSSAITHIDIQYWDCATNTQITNSGGLLFQVNSGNAHEIRTTPAANYVLPLGQFNNSIQYQRIPNPPNDFGPFPTGADPTYQNRVTWDIGLNWNATPSTWCIRLIVAHANGDTCKFSLPSWDPDSATNNAGVTQTNPPPGNVHSVTIGVNWSQFTNTDLGYVLVTPLDTTDEVIGGTGGVWESSPTHDVKSPVSNFVQSKRGALFSLYNGKGLDSKITVFISTPEKDKKPRLKWSLYDKNAGILSTDTIQTNGTVSIVNPPTIVPGTNDVAINSIVPNPASGSVTFNYTLGASEAVRIELFDPLGKSVGIIADGFQTQGSHEINYHVGTLPEGTYYLRLTTRFGKASAVVKVIH